MIPIKPTTIIINNATTAVKKLSYQKKSSLAIPPKPLITNPTHVPLSPNLEILTDSKNFHYQSELLINIRGLATQKQDNYAKAKFLAFIKSFKENYKTVIKDIHAELSTDPKVLQKEAELRKLGVTFTSENDLEITTATFNVFKKIREMGFKTPRKILLTTFKKDNATAYLPGMKKGYEEYATLLIRKNLIEEIKRNKINNTNYPNIEHILLHELGHYNFLLKSPNNDEMFKIYDKFVHTYSHHYIAKHVSFNAITEPNGHEFIAEVFAGLTQGKKFPQPIIDCYHSLGGPQIKQIY